RGAIDGQAVLASFAIIQLDPIDLAEVHSVAAAKPDGKSGLVKAEAQQIIDASLRGLLKIRDGSDGQLTDATAIVGPAAIAVVEGDHNSTVGKIQTVQTNQGQQNRIAAFAYVFDARLIGKMAEIVEVDVAGEIAAMAKEGETHFALASAHFRA